MKINMTIIIAKTTKLIIANDFNLKGKSYYILDVDVLIHVTSDSGIV